MFARAALLLAAVTSFVVAQETSSASSSALPSRVAFPPTMDSRDPKDVSREEANAPLKPEGAGPIKVNFPDVVEECEYFNASVEGGKAPYMVTLIPTSHSWPVFGLSYKSMKTTGEMTWFLDDTDVPAGSFFVVVEDAEGKGGIDTKRVRITPGCTDETKECKCSVKNMIKMFNSMTDETVARANKNAAIGGVCGGAGLGAAVIGVFFICRALAKRRRWKRTRVDNLLIDDLAVSPSRRRSPYIIASDPPDPIPASDPIPPPYQVTDSKVAPTT